MQGGREQQQQQRPPQHSRLDSDSDSDDGQYAMHRKGRQEPPRTSPPPAQSNIAKDLMSGGGRDAGGAGSITGGGSVAAGMQERWEWPQWCLNFKEPCIEVFVEDEETNSGRWVMGEPQSRVVDKTGRDAYLCVEYEWDGEFFVQDFGPQHVRRRGEQKPVISKFVKDF